MRAQARLTFRLGPSPRSLPTGRQLGAHLLERLSSESLVPGDNGLGQQRQGHHSGESAQEVRCQEAQPAGTF